jgi:hypothetical protein
MHTDKCYIKTDIFLEAIGQVPVKVCDSNAKKGEENNNKKTQTIQLLNIREDIGIECYRDD